MGEPDGSDPFEDLHAYARDLQDAAPDLPPDGVRPVGARTTHGATYASRTPHLVVAVAVAFLLVAGGAGTGILADGAVPGDPLYSLDLLIEDTWSAIGLPLDTAAERRAEARALSERADSLVALPATPLDRPAIDTENVGSDAAEKLSELGAALTPGNDASDGEPDGDVGDSGLAGRQAPDEAPVVEPELVVAAPLLELAEPIVPEAPNAIAEPGSLVVLAGPAAEPPAAQQSSPEPASPEPASTTTVPPEEPADDAAAEPAGDEGTEGSADEGSTDQGEAAAAGTKGEAAAVGDRGDAAAAEDRGNAAAATSEEEARQQRAAEAEQRDAERAAKHEAELAAERKAEQERRRADRAKAKEERRAAAELEEPAETTTVRPDDQEADTRTTRRRKDRSDIGQGNRGQGDST